MNVTNNLKTVPNAIISTNSSYAKIRHCVGKIVGYPGDPVVRKMISYNKIHHTGFCVPADGLVFHHALPESTLAKWDGYLTSYPLVWNRKARTDGDRFARSLKPQSMCFPKNRQPGST